MQTIASSYNNFKVAHKLGQSPCTIVQGHVPNDAKNVKLRILGFYNIF